MIVDVRDAVKKASKYLADLYDPSTFGDVYLEEVDFDDMAKEWYVTLSYQRINRQTAGIEPPLLKPEREIKKFRIDADTGMVKSMRIWTPA